MHTIYLKAPDRAALEAALENAGITVDGVPASSRYLLDTVGTIYRETGETTTDDLGIETPVMEPVDGFHANLAIRWQLPSEEEEARRWLAPEAEEILQTIITPDPDTPQRVWA